jgi:hypothetical protein
MAEPVLAKTNVYTGADGLRYACISSTHVIPTKQNVSQLYELVDYIVGLKEHIIVVLDLRGTAILPYLEFLPAVLQRMNLKTDNQIDSAEIWLPKRLQHMKAIVQPIMDAFFKSNKSILVKTL